MRRFCKIALGMALALCLLCSAAQASEVSDEEVRSEISDEISRQAGELDLSQWDGVLHSLPDDALSIWGGKSANEMLSTYANAQTSFGVTDVLDGIWGALKARLAENGFLMVRILVLAMLSGLLSVLSRSMGGGLGETASFICYCLVVAVVITDFASLVGLAQDTITKANAFMQSALPVLLTLLTAVGGVASAGIFQPVMAVLSTLAGTVINSVVMPIVLATGVLAVISNMSDRVQLGQLYGLGKSSAKWILGLTFTLFFGVMGIQGISAASYDGISVRTAKFMLDKFVPVVGRAMSDTVDTVLGCTLLIKNAAGVTAIVTLVSILTSPLIQMMAKMFIFRISAALIEPVCDEKLPKLMNALADVSSYVFAVTLITGAMLVITVGLIMSTGNINIMLR